MTFVKGDPRINRKGAPKKEASLTGILEKLSLEVDDSGVSKREKIARIILAACEKGDRYMIREVLDRLEGKPIQKIQQEIRSLDETLDEIEDNVTYAPWSVEDTPSSSQDE